VFRAKFDKKRRGGETNLSTLSKLAFTLAM